MAKSQDYRTTETTLAACLIQEGFKLLLIEYEQVTPDKRRATFVFSNNSQELQDAINLYNRGQIVGNIVLYEHTKSSLLDRIMRGLP